MTGVRGPQIFAGISILAIVAGLAVIGAAVISTRPGDGDGAAQTTTPPTGSVMASPSGGPAVGSRANDLGIVTPTIQSPKDLEDGRAIGRRDAPATLTVWADFQCPYCADFTRQVQPRLYADYVIPGKLRIVFRDWVFIGAESVAAAVAARCAGEQGQFWTYHDYLFWNQQGENKGGFSGGRLDAMAVAAGLDLTRFDACLADKGQVQDVQAETAAGTQAKINVTPTLVVDDTIMPGAPTKESDYAYLRSVIDASIAAHASSGAGASPS